jgi:hypothetical protein
MRERRAEKQARKDARKQAAADRANRPGDEHQPDASGPDGAMPVS